MAQRHKLHEDEQEDQEFAARRTLPAPSADMNVTPLIDVLLVLLIIFMAALPLTQRGQDVNLPLEATQTSKPKDLTHVVVEFTADRRLSINKTPLALQDLPARLRDLFEARPDKTVFIIGDGAVRYGEVTAIIDAALGLGLRVALVTDGMRAEAAAKKGG